jgi:hypothetical protein
MITGVIRWDEKAGLLMEGVHPNYPGEQFGYWPT